jgi:hypothetical protein
MLKKMMERIYLFKKLKSLEMLSPNERLFLLEYVEENRNLLKTLSEM